ERRNACGEREPRRTANEQLGAADEQRSSGNEEDDRGRAHRAMPSPAAGVPLIRLVDRSRPDPAALARSYCHSTAMGRSRRHHHDVEAAMKPPEVYAEGAAG